MAAALPLLTLRHVDVPPNFEAWRTLAREALMRGDAPETIDFRDATVAAPQSLISTSSELRVVPTERKAYVSALFLEKARVVAAHRDPQRWNLLFRLLYRLQSNRNLLKIEVDADVSAMLRMEQQVRRDIHKMHAFVRFRSMMDQHGEHMIAWYNPEHRILELAAPFFAERFAVMRWSIFTPDASVAWDPLVKQLQFGPGAGRESAPAEDEMEELWKTYYSGIFNPARLNPSVMRSHMPVKYWGQLPEVALIPTLIQSAGERVNEMVQLQTSKPSAAPFVPERHSLPALREAMPGCRGCDLYKCATQVVPGAGGAHAPLMLVGEQPGDQEDLEGKPFVGPAGKLLRKALEEIHVTSKEVFMTNAVKHFKFTQRGKRRMHQSPRMSEITACKPWLLAEIDAVKPKLIVCLGASAAKSLLGGTFALMRDRGKVLSTPFAEHVMATVHPSAVLRAPDHAMREQLFHHLRDDLASALQFVRRAA
ncbi:MAG: UdgX family uracil-DNA binding protein [Acidobacteria bacterium]|nr:UdgX family uracil-DNA binding protein [Acidobacteriota bacterium]